MKPKAITLYDVAQRAGVSYQTVSRVINQAANVSARTREKVGQAMADLHYVPNRVARQLAGKSGCAFGLVTADLSLHAPSQIASAVKSRAAREGFNVLIAMLESISLAACVAAIESLLAQRVDGILVNVPLADSDAAAVAARYPDIPLLFLDVDPNAAVNSLVFDASQGADLGVVHLLQSGITRVALLNGPQTSVAAKLRRQGWRQALQKAGLVPVAESEGDWSAAGGYRHCHELLAQNPQAVLVANDQMALGVLRACAERGIQVPGQLAVMGYDDTADSAWFFPPLTTIRQDFPQLGHACVAWLMSAMAGEQPVSTVLPVSLVVRETTCSRNAPARHARTLAAQLQALAREIARLTPE